MHDDGGGSHGLLNVVSQDTALKGRAKRPFLICVHRTLEIGQAHDPDRRIPVENGELVLTSLVDR